MHPGLSRGGGVRTAIVGGRHSDGEIRAADGQRFGREGMGIQKRTTVEVVSLPRTEFDEV